MLGSEQLARVLGERGEGFQELTLASWDPRKDADHFEQIAEVSGRPIMYEALVTNDRFPHRHRNTMKWLERCRQKGLPVYGQGTTTDAGLTFTFEDWNLFDDSDAWREATTGTVAERTEKLGDPRRRAALKAQMPRESLITNYFDEIIVTECQNPANKKFEGMTLRLAAEESGKDAVDTMLDIAVSENLKTEFFAPVVNSSDLDLPNLRGVIRPSISICRLEILAGFLRADFPAVLRATVEYWRGELASTIPRSVDGAAFSALAVQHVIRYIGTACEYLRYGRDDMVQRAMTKLDRLAEGFLHSRDSYSSVLAKLVGAVARRYETSLWGPVAEMQVGASPDTIEALTQFATAQFANKRALVWLAQAAGISRLRGGGSPSAVVERLRSLRTGHRRICSKTYAKRIMDDYQRVAWSAS